MVETFRLIFFIIRNKKMHIHSTIGFISRLVSSKFEFHIGQDCLSVWY